MKSTKYIQSSPLAGINTYFSQEVKTHFRIIKIFKLRFFRKMGVACQLDILGHYYEIGKIVHSDTIIFKLSNLNQKSSHKLDAKGMNFKN